MELPEFSKEEIAKEIWYRIRVSMAAYSYECLNEIFMDDHEFDALSLKIRPEIKTGKPILDDFFATKFVPSTGMWIRSHPDLIGIAALYEKVKSRGLIKIK